MTLTPHREKELEKIKEEFIIQCGLDDLIKKYGLIGAKVKIADYWLTTMKSEINKVLEGVEKEMEGFTSRCRLCEKNGVNEVGECDNVTEIINKYKQ